MRFAVFFTPAAGSPLAAAGARFLGRDAFTGAAVDQPQIDGIAPDRLAAITADPRRYGFHSTLKPPFGLAAGRSEDDLIGAFEAFAVTRPAFTVRLTVSRLSGFVALTQAEPAPELDGLAADVVRTFEPFRAPLAPADLDRRRRSGLTDRQERHLADWGYPYVFDEFRFHMTLSQRLEGAEADLVETAAGAAFRSLLAAPIAIDTLGLFVEPEPGAPFTIHAIARLSA